MTMGYGREGFTRSYVSWHSKQRAVRWSGQNLEPHQMGYRAATSHIWEKWDEAPLPRRTLGSLAPQCDELHRN
jgi:hypothetical protein